MALFKEGDVVIVQYEPITTIPTDKKRWKIVEVINKPDQTTGRMPMYCLFDGQVFDWRDEEYLKAIIII